MKHELKCWPGFFDEIWEGRKTFEIRRDDRGFKVGDEIVLREYDPHIDAYLGREIEGEIDYLTDFEQKPGFVVFGFLATAFNNQVPPAGVFEKMIERVLK